MGADGNRIKLRVVKYLVIVIDRFSAAVFFDRSVRSLGDNIAEILYSAFSFFIYAGICAEFAIAPQPIIATLIFSDTETPPFQVYLSIHNNTKTGAKSKLRHKKYILFYFFV